MARSNSFDDVRLFAALVVLFVHSPPLYGIGWDLSIGGFFMGSLAVYIFFAISGYLVTQSWESDPQVARYLARRALRLLPALCALVVLTVFVVGPIFTTLSTRHYFANADTWLYLVNAGLVLVRQLPGVFTDTIVSDLGVSPQLWTLHYEAALYVALMVAFRLCGRYAALALACGVVLASGAMLVGERGLFSCLCFVIGAMLYQCRDRVTWRPDVGFIAFAALVVLAPDSSARRIAVLLALSYTAIGIGRSTWRPLRLVTRHGDLSYGVYLWHYVVQQAVNSVLGFESYWVVSLALCLAFTMSIAWLSWRLVERPALSMKPSRESKESRGTSGTPSTAGVAVGGRVPAPGGT